MKFNLQSIFFHFAFELKNWKRFNQNYRNMNTRIYQNTSFVPILHIYPLFRLFPPRSAKKRENVTSIFSFKDS